MISNKVIWGVQVIVLQYNEKTDKNKASEALEDGKPSRKEKGTFLRKLEHLKMQNARTYGRNTCKSR